MRKLTAEVEAFTPKIAEAQARILCSRDHYPANVLVLCTFFGAKKNHRNRYLFEKLFLFRSFSVWLSSESLSLEVRSSLDGFPRFKYRNCESFEPPFQRSSILKTSNATNFFAQKILFFCQRTFFLAYLKHRWLEKHGSAEGRVFSCSNFH